MAVLFSLGWIHCHKPLRLFLANLKRGRCVVAMFVVVTCLHYLNLEMFCFSVLVGAAVVHVWSKQENVLEMLAFLGTAGIGYSQVPFA